MVTFMAKCFYPDILEKPEKDGASKRFEDFALNRKLSDLCSEIHATA